MCRKAIGGFAPPPAYAGWKRRCQSSPRPGATRNASRKNPQAVRTIAALGGLYIAWYADVAASAAIVLTATGFFALAFLFAPGRGLLWQHRFAV